MSNQRNQAGLVWKWAAVLAGIFFYQAESFAGTEISSISVSPLAAVSGQTVSGSLRLNETCRSSSNCTVSLRSSNSTAAPLGTSATIRYGSSSGSFSFVAGNVSTKTVVTLTASYGGRSRSTGTSFSVSPSSISTTTTLPPATTTTTTTLPASPAIPSESTSQQIAGIEIDGWNATAGYWVYGEIILKQRALTAVTVQLQSSSSLAPVPSSVTIAAGEYRGWFTFTAGKASAKTVVTITASDATGSASTGSHFSISPSFQQASPLVYNPNTYDARNHQIIQPMDVCYYLNHCGKESGSTVQMVDMPEGAYPFAQVRDEFMKQIGTFSITPLTSTYKAGGFYSQVWGYQGSYGTAWNVFFWDLADKANTCKINAERNGARSYTFTSVPRSQGGHFKQFIAIYRNDFFGNPTTPQILNSYGQTFKCSW